MNAKAKKVLEKLKAQLGGEISDGELHYGTEPQIFISTEDGETLWLASQRPLYRIKNGKPRLARMHTHGDDKGWYYSPVSAADLPTALELAETRSDPQLAYESLLQDYCLRHLSEIEPGLQLYKRGRVTGAEFDAGGRYIDILALDSTGALVVIELKLPRAHDRAIGQILRYMGWVRQHVAKPKQRVRGIIVARRITEDLRLAAATQPDLKLKEYDLSITIKDA